ncbi:TonB-dependent receptor domain-containing protein [Pseudoxanthomonas broegbernensis]|nr:TonB-dependent receptor [Pseudoxanthomonas broegbernensis]MBB6066245.1 outer membrane receptor protein involved in Fe transport [Pseudoxanthomonas broegbernensis]
MSKASTGIKGRGMAVTWLALAISGALQAQEVDGAQPRTLDTVVVTGTNIRGAKPVGNTVLTIESEQLRASGRATLGDFLRELPANFAGGVATSDNIQGAQDASSAGSNLTGGQGVNLRGLGALSTLVLVNGRRVAASGQFGDFVDLSNIPLAAISHMEVLLDGASAVYGSDAVGGVVNVILKRSGDGTADTVLKVGTTTQGGGEQVQLSQTWGTSWQGGGLFLGVEHHQQNRVRSSDRKIFNGGDFTDRGGSNWQRANNRVSPTANIFAGGAAGNGTVRWTVPGGNGVGLTTNDLVPVADGVGNTFDPWSNLDILPESRRHSLFASFEQSLGDSARLFGDLRYTRRENDYNTGYLMLYGNVPSTSAFHIPGSTNNFGVVVDDLGFKRIGKVDSLGLDLGVSFDLPRDWRGEAAVTYSREDQSRDGHAQRNLNYYDFIPGAGAPAQAPSATACALMGLTPESVAALPGGGTPAQRYCAALGYTAFNPYSTEPLPREVVDQLIGYENVDFDSWLVQASAKADGTVAELPGGALRLALGVDWRREFMSGHLDFNTRGTRDTHVPYGATARNVLATYAEAAIPVVGKGNALPWLRELELSLAARHERYTGLGEYETTNPKLGIHLKPTDALTLRGSWGTSFHAPPMRFMYTGAQPVGGGNAASVQTVARMAPCDTARVPLNGIVGTPGGGGNCSFTALVVSGGAGPELRPEESRTWTLGFDYSPAWAPGLKVGAGYFRLSVEDRIVRIQGGTLPGILDEYFATGTTPYMGSLRPNPDLAEVQGLFDDPRFIGQVGVGPQQAPSDVAMIIYATQSNLATLRMDGVDFSVGYGFDLADGSVLDLFGRGTSLRSYEVKGSPADDYVDQLGSYSSLGNPVKLRSQQGVRWSKGEFSAALTAHYVDDYECRVGCYVAGANGMPVLAAAPVKIGSWTTFDLNMDYDLSRFGGMFDGLRMGLAATNLADKAPPFVNGGTAASDAIPDPYDAANATVIGRTVNLTLSKRW